MTTIDAMRSRGFSMVEVLVSLVLVSVALMGTAKLTTASLSSTNTAYLRSQAAILTDDMMDRMRANVDAARAGNYVIAAGPLLSAPTGSVAEFDCEEWLATLADVMPNGTGLINVDGNGVATVTINWDGAQLPLITSSQL